jgi:EpsD family peptidyl-prolyl cis-trans isomerase
MMHSNSMTCSARLGAVSLAVAAAILMAACGQKKDVVAADAGASEAVAKVNGDELSAAQLQIALQKQRNMRVDIGDAGAKQVLDQLIEEQIIAQKAVAAKLDQDPKVLQQLESARRDILARRFIEAAAETSGKPADDAAQKFFDARPNLFGQRRVYTLQRMDIQAPDERCSEVDAHVRSLKTLPELTDWLKSQNLKATARTEQDSSEQLPATVLEKVAALKDGESTVVPSQTGVTALTLISSVPAPKTLAEARPAIDQFLTAQGRREVIVNLQKTIRDGAKIEYLGRFAALAAPATASAPELLPAASAASQSTPVQK